MTKKIKVLGIGVVAIVIIAVIAFVISGKNGNSNIFGENDEYYLTKSVTTNYNVDAYVDAEDSVVTTIETDYNDKGLIVKEVGKNNNGEILYETYSSYDEYGRLIEEAIGSSYDEYGRLIEKWEVDFSYVKQNGKWIGISTKIDGTYYIETEYDDEYRLLTKNIYEYNDGNYELLTRTENNYNHNGTLLLSCNDVFSSASGNFGTRAKNEFNDAGEQIKYVFCEIELIDEEIIEREIYSEYEIEYKDDKIYKRTYGDRYEILDNINDGKYLYKEYSIQDNTEYGHTILEYDDFDNLVIAETYDENGALSKRTQHYYSTKP